MRDCRMDRRWMRTDLCGIADGEVKEFCGLPRAGKSSSRLRCRCRTLRTARSVATMGERCLLRRRRRGRSRKRWRGVCLRCGFRCGAYRLGSFEFRRNGRSGCIERREEMVWIEGGFDARCEYAFGRERFAEDGAICGFVLKRR